MSGSVLFLKINDIPGLFKPRLSVLGLILQIYFQQGILGMLSGIPLAHLCVEVRGLFI